MKKPTQFEMDYQALTRIEDGSLNDEGMLVLKRAINGSNSLLASKAAEIIGNGGLEDLIPDMISAFHRFMIDGAKVDKQCAAKIAIANALNTLEYLGDEVFLAGATYVQAEPSYGGPVDTAIKLRCACAYGLARTVHRDAHYILADLLVDPDHGVRITNPAVDAEYEVRSAAAKALTFMGTPEAELLLRLKVLTGDRNPEVIGECFTGLLAMAPNRSLEFVARYLKRDDPSVAELAALAIGGSRIPQSFDVLRRQWDEDMSPGVRRTLLLPIALVRSDEAFGFLLEVLTGADSKTADEAVSALSLYADDESVSKIRAALEDKGDPDLLKRFQREYDR